MKTTIDLNGLRIEHNGGDSVLLISEAPTEIAIDDLISELTSLRSETSEESKSDRPLRQSPYTRLARLNRITELG